MVKEETLFQAFVDSIASSGIKADLVTALVDQDANRWYCADELIQVDEAYTGSIRVMWIDVDFDEYVENYVYVLISDAALRFQTVLVNTSLKQ